MRALEAGLEQTVCGVGLLDGVKPAHCREGSTSPLRLWHGQYPVERLQERLLVAGW